MVRVDNALDVAEVGGCETESYGATQKHFLRESIQCLASVKKQMLWKLSPVKVYWGY